MSEEPLTFSELRKKQKEEKRTDELTEIDEQFIINASNYLKMKKEEGGEHNREFKNAKRVIEKIISLREDKIFKQAKIASKTSVNTEKLNLLPREQKLFRKLKQTFQEHRKEINEHLEKETNTKETKRKTESNKEEIEPKEDTITKSKDKTKKNEEKTETNAEEGYKIVKIISDVPEFMGTDLNSYGPFEEGEEVEIPEENAEILINRGSAKQKS